MKNKETNESNLDRMLSLINQGFEYEKLKEKIRELHTTMVYYDWKNDSIVAGDKFS